MPECEHSIRAFEFYKTHEVLRSNERFGRGDYELSSSERDEKINTLFVCEASFTADENASVSSSASHPECHSSPESLVAVCPSVRVRPEILKSGSSVHPALLRKETEGVRDQQRSPLYCDQLLQHLSLLPAERPQ